MTIVTIKGMGMDMKNDELQAYHLSVYVATYVI